MTGPWYRLNFKGDQWVVLCLKTEFLFSVCTVLKFDWWSDCSTVNYSLLSWSPHFPTAKTSNTFCCSVLNLVVQIFFFFFQCFCWCSVFLKYCHFPGEKKTVCPAIPSGLRSFRVEQHHESAQRNPGQGQSCSFNPHRLLLTWPRLTAGEVWVNLFVQNAAGLNVPPVKELQSGRGYVRSWKQ